jgi:hypothetical protein
MRGLQQHRIGGNPGNCLLERALYDIINLGGLNVDNTINKFTVVKGGLPEKPSFDFENKVKETQNDYEKRLQEKKELAKDDSSDIRDILTDDELDDLISRNVYFNGKLGRFSKMQRHSKIAQIVRFLEKKVMMVHSVNAPPFSKDRPNAQITLDISGMSYFHKDTLMAVSALAALADTLTVCVLDDGDIRYTYGIMDIYSER